MPAVLSASAPQRGHSQTAGTSASTDIVISNSCPLRAAISDLLASRELDPALVLETLAAESGPTQGALRHEPPPNA